ncbi:MAG TPA: hypothetical protein VNU66_10320 [Mycobacteriales bacterium]|nr:hypothetical protein [Mycobacteriales bacterium]
MHRTDRKLQLLARLCGPQAPADLDLRGRLVELTEHRAGGVVAPAGCAGRWVTRVLEGELATTVPAARWQAPAVLEHGPETALVAQTDVVLLTAAVRDLPLVAALLPRPVTTGPVPVPVAAGR